MTIIDGFYNKECNKIDALCVNAYLDMYLSEEDPTHLILESSWGKDETDLTPAVKAAETLTYLKLSPANNPEYLEYDGEDGIPQCIHGDDLSRIISMTKLKDVDQSTTISGGDVYMYDSTTNTFKPFNLQSFVDNTNNAITNLTAQVRNLQNTVSALQALLTKPAGIPDDAVIAWGNRNVYGDYTNTNKRDHGIFTHSTATTLADDQYFA